ARPQPLHDDAGRRRFRHLDPRGRRLLAEEDGVRYRAVIERAVLEQTGATADATSAIESGEEVRVVDRVPTKLAIADRALAMLPLAGDPAAPPAAMIITAAGSSTPSSPGRAGCEAPSGSGHGRRTPTPPRRSTSSITRS
ncbi:MAG TPA: hypothetical protein VGX25_09075, partial [Actinophytocola sp.]|uniref:hypothetical protein n=1 Tax=Actinophytocola sp. TaxID=1872138 RepID=UPI002DE2EF09|nr:hypothetical protein [Actinophytocola sp.]